MQHFNVQILGCRPDLAQPEEYVYEGVNVLNLNSKHAFIDYIQNNPPDIIGIHFVAGWMVDSILAHVKVPVFIWIHGYEALGWYRRLFNFKLSESVSFGKYILSNTRQMLRMNKLSQISNKQKNIRFIFVSNWMKTIMETDTRSKIEQYYLIPNPIDSEQFAYHPKASELRKKILLIRSFDSKKYANDIAIEAILHLSKKDFFKELDFTIYGKGKYFKPLTDRLVQFNNVKIVNEFVENKNIPSVHREYGVFLCPTRQDAQGVSMCEAMSSGLVPVTSNNTAIPEFITDGQNGLLSNSAQEMATCIEKLYRHPELFTAISVKAAKSIRAMAGHQVVINKEISLLSEALRGTN